jgi:hypothetical protein
LHFAFAGFDEGLEAQGSAPAVRPRVVLAHRELTNGEPRSRKQFDATCRAALFAGLLVGVNPGRKRTSRPRNRVLLEPAGRTGVSW